MDCQQVEASNIIVPPPVSIHVMVVDDDATSLAVVSSLLKTLNYQVASFNDPIRALNTLRAGKQSFDLVLTALYMPKMDGFELTRRVNDEFKLPVIMISTDDRESVMFKAIQEGVELYLLKPFSPNDLKNIWQFVITTKSKSIPDPNLIIDDTRSHGVEFRAAVEAHSISSSNEVMPERKKKKDSKGKGGNQEKANDEMELTPTKKKAKVVWTDFLQYRFLHAVHYIGLDRAVPKKILEVMNVPGLTRENVASHLQKYRIFLRKVAERCTISCNKTPEETIWSKFLSRHASLVLEKIQQKRVFHLNSSQNPNNPPFSNHQSSNPNNGDRRRFTNGQLNFAKNLPTYGLGHTASFVNHGVGPLPVNQNNAQVFNFSVTQFQNLALFEDSYLGSCFPSNNNYYPGISVDVDGEFSATQKGVSNGFDGSYVGFDAMGVENFQRDEFGQYGIGFGGDNNSYNWGLMCNNGVNFGGDSQNTVRHSSHALNNKEGVQEDIGFFASLYPLESFVDNSIPNQQQGSGGFMKEQSHQLHNMYSADEESSTTDPFSIDDQVLDEFLTSLLRNDNNST